MQRYRPTGRLSGPPDVGIEPPGKPGVTGNRGGSKPAGCHVGWLLGGRYRLDELIARGATAEVFRGTDELLGRRVAVKVFNPVDTDLNSVERRRVEVEVLASLSDPHLVTVHDALIDPGSSGNSFVVMELVEGPTLAEEIGAGPVEPARAACIGAAVAAALETMHRRGLVHRDVKPANILSTTDGAVKLGDFGLARVLTADDRVTSAPLVMGTAAFFSPEQAGGQDVEAPSDVYSLGLVLLEALTGRREYPGSPVESAIARLFRGPVIPAALPLPWPPLLTAMTSEDPQARPTAGAVRAALAGAHPAPAPPRTAPLLGPIPTGPGTPTAVGPPGALTSTTMLSRPPSATRSRRARLVMASLAAAVAVALSSVLLLSPLSGTSPAEPAPPAPTGPATSVQVPAAAVTRPSTPTARAKASTRPAATTTARPTPPTTSASRESVRQAPAVTADTPANEPDPTPAAKRPEPAIRASGTPTAPAAAGNAGATNKKAKSKGNEKTDTSGSSKGKGKGKG